MFAKLDLQTYWFEKYYYCFANLNWHTGQIVIQTNSNPVLVFSNITWSVGDKKNQFYTFNNNFGKLGPVK